MAPKIPLVYKVPSDVFAKAAKIMSQKADGDGDPTPEWLCKALSVVLYECPKTSDIRARSIMEEGIVGLVLKTLMSAENLTLDQRKLLMILASRSTALAAAFSCAINAPALIRPNMDLGGLEFTEVGETTKDERDLLDSPYLEVQELAREHFAREAEAKAANEVTAVGATAAVDTSALSNLKPAQE